MNDSTTPRRGRGRPREVERRRPGVGAPLSKGPADYPQTTRAILDAALRVVLSRGAQGLTLVAVAREAHVDVTTVSYHFGTRAGLIEGLMDHLYRGLVAEWVEQLQHLQSIEERVDAYFQSIRSMYADRDASQAYFEIVTLAMRDPALRARLARLNQWIVESYIEAMLGPETPGRRILGELTFAVVDGIDLHRAIGTDVDYPFEAVLELYERLVRPLWTSDAFAGE
jgi:AcrR family transcriptional regulator